MSKPKPYRVIVWGTGLVGKAVLRGLLTNPHYEVVAVIVSTDDKDGRDVGDIVGVAPTGMLATTNAEATLALDADAVAYFGPSALHAEINIANLTQALRAGKNVVETTMGALENPEYAPAELRDVIEAACVAGNSSLFSGGIDPGFGNDLLPINLLGVCARVHSVRTIEFIDAGTYPDQESLIQMGLKSREENETVLEIPGVMASVWGGPLQMIASALGVQVESTVENYQRWFAPKTVDYPRGRVEAGECAAHRIELQGIVDGKPKIFIDHYHRLYPQAAPDWQRPVSHHVHANRIEIDGDPTINQETVIENPHTGDGNEGTCLATGMRAIHAIPAVCAAEPGILSTLTLPIIGGLGAMH